MIKQFCRTFSGGGLDFYKGYLYKSFKIFIGPAYKSYIFM